MKSEQIRVFKLGSSQTCELPPNVFLNFRYSKETDSETISEIVQWLNDYEDAGLEPVYWSKREFRMAVDGKIKIHTVFSFSDETFRIFFRMFW